MKHASATEARLDHLDLIRGYALLGVLLMNIQYWLRTPPQRYWSTPHPWPEAYNVATDLALKVWFDGKSATLFSMMFAVGLCMQRDSILGKGFKWGPYSFRRLGAMFGLGLLHIFFFWNGDVLTHYAVSGLLILPFLKRKPKTLSWWLGSILSLATLAMLGFFVWVLYHPDSIGKGGVDPKMQERIQVLVQGYSQRSWVGVLRTRLWDWVQLLKMLFPGVLVLYFINFLAGLWIWRKGILQDPGAHRDTIRRVATWGMTLGLVMNVISAATPAYLEHLRSHWDAARFAMPLFGLAQIFGLMVLATGIAAGVLHLWLAGNAPSWLRPLTLVGRMGFTNYILQSVFCTAIFYGWGLGLYNRVGPAVGTLIGLAIFAVQIPLSHWWLARYRFGPLEWLWRTLTYAEAQPMRRDPSRATQPAESASG